MGIEIPYPQKDSRTYELSGSVTTGIAFGEFVFDPITPNPIAQVRKGILYRILSVSFSADCGETEFRQAFLPFGNFAEPLARLVLTGNYTIAPKSWPIRDFYQSRKTLNYFIPSADNSEIGISFAGRFDAAKIPGLASLTLSYSFLMQELASETWAKAYTEGKF